MLELRINRALIEADQPISFELVLEPVSEQPHVYAERAE
jgi:hypothetical protein